MSAPLRISWTLKNQLPGWRLMITRMQSGSNTTSKPPASSKPPPPTSSKPPQPQVVQADNSSYKVPEYYAHNEFSYYEIDSAMAKFRIGQPSKYKPIPYGSKK